MKFTVHNNGDMESAPADVKYYGSDDSTITSSDDHLWGGNVEKISPGNSRNVYFNVGPRTRYYGAIVDSVSGESDTSNNASNALHISAYLATPRGLTATSIGTSSIRMEWDSVSGSNVEYVLRRDRTVVYRGTDSVIRIRGLSGGTGIYL